jgi:hypothetical protein
MRGLVSWKFAIIAILILGGKTVCSALDRISTRQAWLLVDNTMSRGRMLVSIEGFYGWGSRRDNQ